MQIQPAHRPTPTAAAATLTIRASRRSAALHAHHELTTAEDLCRDPLPAGHPRSWDLITRGTLLEGTPYFFSQGRI